jgi:hypothetical protein
MGGFRGRKDPLSGVAPGLAAIALTVSEIRNDRKDCRQVLDESATGSGQYFRKTFKKVSKSG